MLSKTFVHSRLHRKEEYQAQAIPFEKGAFREALPDVGWSDHWAFGQTGYPARMITDRAPFQVTQALFKAIEHLAFRA